jgi:hypothetical protein
VDCYAPPGSATLSTPIWWSDTLMSGAHTLRIRLTGTKNEASAGTIVVADYFSVQSLTLAAIKARYDESGAHATWTGAWIKSANSAYHGGAYAYSRWTTASYRSSFYGTKAAWIGPKTTAYGTARVYIDGVFQTTVDQYGTMGWRQQVWESPSLARGNHTIEIRPTGAKRAASTGTNVVVDAIDVTP